MNNLFRKFEVKSRSQIVKEITNTMCKKEKKVVVTANTEIIDHVLKDNHNFQLLENLKSDNSLIIADGVGIQKFLNKKLKYTITRYPGVELINDLLPILDEKELKLCTLGGSKISSENFNKYISINYPHIKIVGQQDGYIEKEKMNYYLRQMAKHSPDLILVGLGVPIQENIIFHNLPHFQNGVFIGCGGSMDVLGGTKKRAPILFQKIKMEWFYRIIKEPKRIPKFIGTQISFIKNTSKKI